MLGPSKPKLLIVGRGGIPQNPYPANESVNLSLSNSSSNIAVFAPLVLPQQNVLVVQKQMSDTRKGGMDLGLPKAQHLLEKNLDTSYDPSNEQLDGAGPDKKVNKDKLENMFLHPIKVCVTYLTVKTICDFFRCLALSLNN